MVLAQGTSVGEKIASGAARVTTDVYRLSEFKPGEMLIVDTTTPDWEPVMKTAASIVTNRGGRTCHATIVSRELGILEKILVEEGETVPVGTVLALIREEGKPLPEERPAAAPEARVILPELRRLSSEADPIRLIENSFGGLSNIALYCTPVVADCLRIRLRPSPALVVPVQGTTQVDCPSYSVQKGGYVEQKVSHDFLVSSPPGAQTYPSAESLRPSDRHSSP